MKLIKGLSKQVCDSCGMQVYRNGGSVEQCFNDFYGKRKTESEEIEVIVCVGYNDGSDVCRQRNCTGDKSGWSN